MVLLNNVAWHGMAWLRICMLSIVYNACAALVNFKIPFILASSTYFCRMVYSIRRRTHRVVPPIFIFPLFRHHSHARSRTEKILSSSACHLPISFWLFSFRCLVRLFFSLSFNTIFSRRLCAAHFVHIIKLTPKCWNCIFLLERKKRNQSQRRRDEEPTPPSPIANIISTFYDMRTNFVIEINAERRIHTEHNKPHRTQDIRRIYI